MHMSPARRPRFVKATQTIQRLRNEHPSRPDSTETNSIAEDHCSIVFVDDKGQHQKSISRPARLLHCKSSRSVRCRCPCRRNPKSKVCGPEQMNRLTLAEFCQLQTEAKKSSAQEFPPTIFLRRIAVRAFPDGDIATYKDFTSGKTYAFPQGEK